MKDEKRKLFIFPDIFSIKLGGEIKEMKEKNQWIGVLMTISITILALAIMSIVSVGQAIPWIDISSVIPGILFVGIMIFLFVGMSIIIALFCVALAIVNLQKEEKEEETKEKEKKQQ